MRYATLLMALFLSLAASDLLAEVKELEGLTEKLKSGSLAEKTKAVRLLGEIGPAAAETVPLLLESLNTEYQGLRYEVAIALGRINSDASTVVRALTQLLSDPSPHVKNSAIESLRLFGDASRPSLPQLLSMLNDKEPLIRVGAARAIVQIEDAEGDATVKAIPILVAALTNERHDVSIEAIHGVASAGETAVFAIANLLDGKNLVGKLNACDALAAIGPAAGSATDRLIDTVSALEPKLRAQAIMALGEIGPPAERSIPVLINALLDADIQVRISAEHSLRRFGKAALPALMDGLKSETLQKSVVPAIAELGSEAAGAVGSLAQLLKSKDSALQRETIIALAAIGPEAKSTTPQLIKLLQDEQFNFRPAAAFALGRMHDEKALPALKGAVDTSDNEVLRIASVWALLQIDPTNKEYVTSAVPLLTTALSSERPEIRRESAQTLGQLESRAATAVPALERLLNDHDRIVRRASLIALAEIGPDSQSATAAILRYLTEGDPEMHPIAAYALGRIGPPARSAIPTLQRMLNGRDPHETTLAAWALAQITPDPETIGITIPFLCAALVRAENPKVRLEVAKTLGSIGSGSEIAKKTLQESLKDSNESVRKAAESAISQLK